MPHTTIKTPHGEFITNPECWMDSGEYFRKLFSGRFNDRQEDGSYFIETDDRVFEHVLRYLRTAVLPVFYDSAKGHDFALYQSLLAEAEFFGIKRLCRWLREKKYLEVVKVRHLAMETQDRLLARIYTQSDPEGRTFLHENAQFVEVDSSGAMEVSILPMTVQQNVFYCPNGKHGRSNEEYCKSCSSQASRDGINVTGGWRSEDTLRWCIVRKETIFDLNLCVTAYPEELSQARSATVRPAE